ncbi:hypothetical protein AYO20_01154 [Fonsecaea nubica]|uniref:Uncharacterized protein n=1 Tax=Fonsecaea nubica TaxID=856822 RepID=A0A178DDK0_9EURO|nr:hypothetical protein AYO20_01154 [Fonsecaea nubica]OAL39757.1 hypothetical protein AYO20_01154 [Fonsecaea nubica]
MVDPLTTFAAAGNALQFVSLGIDLVRKTIDYANGGGNNYFESLKDCVQRLSVSSAHLQTSMESSASQLLPPGPARGLHRANLECLKVSQEFTATLDKLGLNRRHSLWKSGESLDTRILDFKICTMATFWLSNTAYANHFNMVVKLALKSHAEKSYIDTLSRNLDHARANLMLSLMVYLHDQSAVDRQNMSEGMRIIADQALRATKASADIKADIAKLNSSLSSLAIDDTTISLDVEDALERSGTYLANEIKGLFTRLERLDDNLKALLDEVHRLLPTMNSELAARRSIVESLWFPEINNRRNNIGRAFTNTYQWIFMHKDNQGIVWDDFVEWLHSSKHPIYWVSGKPGSGKSTLLRELDECANELLSRSASGDDADFLKASFYFWYAGTNDEKSMSGLLRTLIHQLLSPHLDLVDRVVSGSKWEASLGGYSRLHVWEENELVEVLSRTIQHLGRSKQILLFIDGLDEHNGSDDQRQKALDLIHRLARNQNVKACVASRPYNIFRDGFRECPQLRLEDLTKEDIRLYVHGKLAQNLHFQRQLRGEPQLLDNLTTEITSRARGVFLWVHLVVRDLLRVLRDGGRGKHLFRELESIPLDLDDYFQRIFESVPVPYRKDASIILQTALSCSSEDAVGVRGVTDFQFRLMHLHFLDQSEDLCFGANSQLYDVDFTHPQEGSDLLELLERMLMSRCMGLLETGSNTDENGYYGYSQTMNPGTRIEFLHRTVRDYFAGRAARDLLHRHTDSPFDAHMFQCNLMAIDIRTFGRYGATFGRGLFDVEKFLRHIIERPDEEEAAFVLFEKVVEPFDGIEMATSNYDYSHLNIQSGIIHLIFRSWSEHRSNAISLSIQLGWKSYVKARLTEAKVREKEGRPLLHYALTPLTECWTLPDPSILSDLLRLGANLDELVSTPYLSVPIWASFLTAIPYIEDLDYTRCLEIVKMLVLHGTRPLDLARHHFIHNSALYPDMRRGVGRPCRTNRQQKDDAETLFSFLDVAESLVRRSFDGSKSPVFTEEDIVTLRELELSRYGKSPDYHPSLEQPVLGAKRARESSPSQTDDVQLESNGRGHDSDGEEQPLQKKTRR